MFGSIATTPTNMNSAKDAVGDRPPSNPTNPKDPWNDSSLIQFWQQSIESYKLHHSSTSKTQVFNDPLLERTKRLESTIEDDQTSNRKRTKLDHTNKATFPIEPSTTNVYAIESSLPAEKPVKQTNTQQDTHDDWDLEHINEIEQQNDSANADADADKENEYEYDPADVEEGYQEYDYDQDPDKENQDYQDYYGQDYTHGYQQNPQYYQHYQHQDQPQSAPVPPPPPPMFGSQGNGNEALTNMIMAWYYSGYYTGLYQARQR